MDLSTRQGPREGSFDRVLVVLAVIVAGWSAWSAAAARSELRHAADAVAEAQRDTDAATARLRELDSKRSPDAEHLTSRAEWTRTAPPPRVLADLTALLPPDVRLASVSLAYAEGVEVVAQVAARNAAAYDVFLDRLVASPRFAKVEPGDEGRDGEIQARVQMTWRSAP